MVTYSQSFSEPRNVQLPRMTFRRPAEINAADVCEITAKCPQLDRNLLYYEQLLAVISPPPACLLREMVRWLAGCRPTRGRATAPRSAFGIAVQPKLRNMRLGKELILSALNRPACEGVTHIKVTVARPTGRPGCSSQLWLGTRVRQYGKLWFDRETKERHEERAHDSHRLHRSSISPQAFPAVCLPNTQIGRQR